MAASALAQIRVSRVDEGEVHLIGPAGAIGVFRSRVDEASRALSAVLGRRVRAVLTAEASEAASGHTEARVSITMEEAREHPLVLAAKKAFNAEVQRVDPAARIDSAASGRSSVQEPTE